MYAQTSSVLPAGKGNTQTMNRWDSMMASRRADDMRPLADPTLIGPPIWAGPRLRVEEGGECARDRINSRTWESVMNTGPLQTSAQQIYNASQTSLVYMDMNPTASRKSNVSYQQFPTYYPDPERGPTTEEDLGFAPPPAKLQIPARTNMNPFLQRLDFEKDGRNIIRELRSSVNEDNRELDTDIARRMSERNFTGMFISEAESKRASMLQAYDLLRPKQDDWNKSFR